MCTHKFFVFCSSHFLLRLWFCLVICGGHLRSVSIPYYFVGGILCVPMNSLCFVHPIFFFVYGFGFSWPMYVCCG